MVNQRSLVYSPPMYSAPYVGPMSVILLEAWERDMVNGKKCGGGGKQGKMFYKTGLVAMEHRLLCPDWDSMILLWPVAIRATEAEPVQGSLQPVLYKGQGFFECSFEVWSNGKLLEADWRGTNRTLWLSNWTPCVAWTDLERTTNADNLEIKRANPWPKWWWW